VNHLVLSGTLSIVPSGTRSTCYRGPKSGKNSCLSKACHASNFSNLDSFGIYLTNFAFSFVGEKTRAATEVRVMIVALFNRKSDGGKTNVTFDPVGGWTRQQLRLVVIHADRKGENENCWLDWSEQRAQEGLTRRFEVIGLTPGAPRREALEVAITDDDVVSDEPLRFAVPTLSVLLVSDVPLTPFQHSPSGEGASVEIQKPLEKVRIFRPNLLPRFTLNRYGPHALTVRERPEVLAKRDPPTPCSHVGRRTGFTHAVCSGQLLLEANKDGHAARADDRAHCRNRKDRPVTACDRKSAFAQRPGDSEARRRRIEDRAVESAAKTQRFIARLPIDVTPELRGRIKVVAFQRGQMVTEMPRDPRAREFPQRQGATFDGRSHRG
jgi:chromosome partitioning protein